MSASSERVALATAAEVPDLDEEGQLLVRALRDLGVEVGPVVWDDDTVAWADYALVVVRSTWDYALRSDAFLSWARTVAEATEIANPVGMLEWSTDKRYLHDLDRAGVPVVDSILLGAGDDPHHDLLDIEHVVKPTVSAGSKDTLRLSAGQHERSIAHVEAIVDSGRTALVQPYLRAVDEHGETALIYVEGRLSHAIRKAPILTADAVLVDGLFAEEEISSREPSEPELAVGAQALAVVPGFRHAPPLYARVDLLPDDEAEPQVLEVELAEPSLFLKHHGPAPSTMATAIVRRLGRGH